MYFKPRIFISSTMGDKLELRETIKRWFESAGAEVALYEKDLTPSINPNTYREDILHTDFVIFILDERYGEKTNTGLSGTEEEFHIVSHNKKPCHVYLKHIEKTDEAKKFEDLIKSKGISYYYYKDDEDLLQRIQSTCFTIAKDIFMSNLYSQRIDPFILNKAAKKSDYTLGLYYCEMFETLLEICSKTPYKIENSNLLIAAFDGLSDWVNNTKTIFIDQKLEELFREIFVCINEINRYTSSTSSPNLPFVNIPFPHMNEISVCFNNYCGAYDSAWINGRASEMINRYTNFKTYLAHMQIAGDLL